MKLYILLASITLLATACTDTKKQEKEALSKVIEIHDKAMAHDEQAVRNKMLLDSLIKNNADEAAKVMPVVNNLTIADKAMEDWMHQFNADNTGKSHEEVMQYLDDQKKKVSKINNQLATAVNQSNQLISTLKK
ncbi:hypothetical protein ABDD95_10450 [Mucilaginibacter sp. PAMB04274]|uniref:hypothetical protein n=1 Tax=Mucilaginibacter sp. PAMB04274 TaxID=3138568 RepID=UPI0031F6EBF0